MTHAIAIEDERKCVIIKALPVARQTRGFVVDCPAAYRIS